MISEFKASWSIDQVPCQLSLGSERNHGKQKAVELVIEQGGGGIFQLKPAAAELDRFDHWVLALESRIEEKDIGISLYN